jgi:uncharacterized cupin superfamily protein
VNLRDCEVQVAEELPTGFRHLRASIRPELGGEQIGCTVYELPVGERLWPYHGHWNNEEWAIVVDGTPTLRTPEGERELRAGDVVGFAQGEAGAHTFTNSGDAPARIAIFSTLRPGTALYPDSDKIGAGPREDRRYFRRGDAVDYWDGEQP